MEGTLYRSAFRAQEQAKERLNALMDQGYDYHQAWEVVRQVLFLLPESSPDDLNAHVPTPV